MDCCPTQIKDLGCFSSCENVPLPNLSVTGGKMITKFHGHLHVLSGDFAAAIPTDTLNESYTYVVQFYDSLGNLVEINGFDAFRFTLLPKV